MSEQINELYIHRRGEKRIELITVTETMTIAELLLSQRGWGPARSAKMLRSVSLSEKKTLGSLTSRQRLMLAAVLSSDENKEHKLRPS